MSLFKKIRIKINYYRNIKKKQSYDVAHAKDKPVINWAIMGLGNMANKFVRALKVTPGANVVAVASRSQEKADAFARKYHITHSFGNYESMLVNQKLAIDVVYIATPVSCHYDNIKQALNNNKNVLCEKPIVMNTNELQELQEIANRKKLLLSEGLWMLYLPVFQKAKQWISINKIGIIKGIRVDLSKQEIIDYSKLKYTNTKGGGVLADYGIYPIAFAASFMSVPIAVEYCHFLLHEKGFDKDWLLLLSDTSIKAQISISSDFDGSRKAVIFGEKGTIVWETQFNRANSITCFNSEGKVMETYSVNYQADGFEYEIEEIQNCLRNNKQMTDNVPLSFSLNVLRIMEILKNQI